MGKKKAKGIGIDKFASWNQHIFGGLLTGSIAKYRLKFSTRLPVEKIWETIQKNHVWRDCDFLKIEKWLKFDVLPWGYCETLTSCFCSCYQKGPWNLVLKDLISWEAKTVSFKLDLPVKREIEISAILLMNSFREIHSRESRMQKFHLNLKTTDVSHVFILTKMLWKLKYLSWKIWNKT